MANSVILKEIGVQLLRDGSIYGGELCVMACHMVYVDSQSSKKNLWIAYPLIQQVERRPHSIGGFSALRIRCRDFTFLTLNFESETDCERVFETVRTLTCITSIDKLYAFSYTAPKSERDFNSWNLYSAEKEFQRQGLGSTFPQWRITSLNHDHAFSPTYPSTIAIPAAISDNVLTYGGKYRSKARIPVLTYIHALNGCTITRASQPMVGIKQNRSLQDEKLVSSIFDSTNTRPDVYGATASGHLIVDARPTANAMANVALGAGTEIMDHYPTGKKIYLGIENIHVMRDSLSKVVEAMKDSDLTPLPPNKEALLKSSWLKHISQVWDGAQIVANTIHVGGSHVLVHCSDGWDRTSQLCSLAELTLDPYYRTYEGFMILIEKDWLSFGHRFAERSGHLASEKSFVNNAPVSTYSSMNATDAASPGSPRAEEKPNRAQFTFTTLTKKLGEVKFGNQQSHLKYTSPIFHQFLDCVFQILTQHPDSFEFNDRFLRRLLYHTYSCQYGSFLYNNERERVESKVSERTRCVWDHFLPPQKRELFTNPTYQTPRKGEDIWLKIDTRKIKWWAEMFGKSEDEMNGSAKARTEAGAGASAPILGVENGKDVIESDLYGSSETQLETLSPSELRAADTTTDLCDVSDTDDKDEDGDGRVRNGGERADASATSEEPSEDTAIEL